MSVFQPTSSSGWVPFSESITDRLNEEKAWFFVCNEDVVRERYPSYTAPQINAAINSTFLMMSDIFKTLSQESRSSDNTTTNGGGDASWSDPLDTKQCLGCVLISKPDDCETYYECTAVWGQPLLLSLVDMSVDASYVCDFRWTMKLVEYFLDNTPHTQHPSPQHQQDHLPPGLLPQPLLESRAGVVSFITQVMRGQYPKALQGKKPCPVHAPPTAMGMCTALQGVSCTFRPLVYDPFCDVVTGVFSKRCPCCPEVMYMLDYVVRHINVHRSRYDHEPGRDPYWSGGKCVYSTTSSHIPTTTFPEDSSAATQENGSPADSTTTTTAAAGPVAVDEESRPAVFSHTNSGLLRTRLRLVILNIEENDLGPQDWPTQEDMQIVPHIRIYPACVRREEMHPTGGRPLPRSPNDTDPLLDRTAICDHCGVSVPIFRPEGTVERDTRLVGNKVSHVFAGTQRTPEHLLRFILDHIVLTKLDAEGEKRVLAQFKKCSEKRARASPDVGEEGEETGVSKGGPKIEVA